MKRTMFATIMLAVASTAALPAWAEDPGEQAARGAGFALVVAEKCRAAPDDMTAVTARQRSLFVSLQKAGYDFEAIKRGYLIGVMSAEQQYRGSKKPSKKDCAEANKIKAAIARL